MIGILVGLVYFNAGEWFAHKYILHGLGKNKKSFQAYHWHDHHQHARKFDLYDPDYEGAFWQSKNQFKEAAQLILIAAAHLPLLSIFPFFTLTVVASAWNYFRVHKKAHLHPEWARKHLAWHVDHHLGRNQDANWCVTHPLFDYVMGTRVPYLGTQAQMQDDARRVARRRAKTNDAPK